MTSEATSRPGAEPLACSLGSAGAATQQERLRAACEAALVTRRRDDDGIELRFRADDSTRAMLDEFVAVERSCCPFLDLSLTSAADVVVLSIAGAPGSEPVLDALYACAAPRAS